MISDVSLAIIQVSLAILMGTLAVGGLIAIGTAVIHEIRDWRNKR